MRDERTRSINTVIAGNYDALLYDPAPQPVNDIRRIYGVASAFGGVRKPRDVLDIGCGTGTQLLQVADQLDGRLVGTDISAIACEKAREKLVPYGQRTQILCADLLELQPEDLGEFDLIYVIGTIYVTPDAVQRKILDLVGRCLRPGGVVQISYYAGAIPALRAQIYSQLRSATRHASSRGDAVAIACKHLAALAKTVADGEGADFLRVAIEATQGLPDIIFFHEVLNGAFAPMQTGQIEHELAQFGLSFAGYALPISTNAALPSRDRALMADVHDIQHGGYHYATFAKFDGTSPGLVRDWPVSWESTLLREPGGDLLGQKTFHVRDSAGQVEVRDPAMVAALDALTAGPLAWPELAAKVAGILAAANLPTGAAELDMVERNLCMLWHHGLVLPLYG